MLLQELLPDYRQYLLYERQLARQTVYAYMSDARLFAAWINKDVYDISRNDLRDYMRHLGKAGYSRTTVRRVFHGFGTLWRWLYLEGHVESVITKYIDLPRKNIPLPRWLSEDELQQFVDAARSPEVPLHEQTAWLILAYLGLRPEEVRALKVKDVNTVDRIITVRNTKSKRDRALPIPNNLNLVLFRALRGKLAEDYVCSADGHFWGKIAFYNAFKRQKKRAGLTGQGITPRTLRHTFATHLGIAGVSGHIIKELLGHKDLSTTDRYLHAAPVNLRAAMDRFVLNRE